MVPKIYTVVVVYEDSNDAIRCITGIVSLKVGEDFEPVQLINKIINDNQEKSDIQRILFSDTVEVEHKIIRSHLNDICGVN